MGLAEGYALNYDFLSSLLVAWLVFVQRLSLVSDVNILLYVSSACFSATDSRSMNLTQISVDAVTVRRHLAVSGGVHSDSCLGVLLAVSLLVACVVIHVSSLAVFRLHQQWKVSL